MSQSADAPVDQPKRLGFLWRKAPYLIAFGFACFGVAYTSISHQTLYGYWEFLAVVIGLACVAIGWFATSERAERVKLLRTQALHWGAFLVAMNILLMPSVQNLLTSPGTGLAMMLLLALGTFVAGIYVSLDIAVLGVAMALSVPAIAWMKISSLLIVLILLAVLGVAVVFWRR
ncbi:MAG TPA: hypothetical protein VK446_06960 [Methylocystis sp.]|nr:hypothetical protein [Methylocystis sp.]